MGKLVYFEGVAMSVDWNIIDRKTKTYCHLGQSMGQFNSFGYGSKDEQGREFAGKYIQQHIDYDNNLQVCLTDNIPEDYTEIK